MNLSKRTETPEEVACDYEETCQAIAEGLADVEAGRTVSFEEAWAEREARRVARVNLSKRTERLLNSSVTE